ncbi:MAG TPA: hypothetical protein VL990_01900, partial [Acidobacteriaceae bacterium]|nr:hypothetical protein [Acidobacteriaceae bacterium]
MLFTNFTELRCTDNGVGDRGGLDQLLLSHFGAEEAAGQHVFGPDHGQRNVMFHARAPFVVEQLEGRRFEEPQHRSIFSGGGVRY